MAKSGSKLHIDKLAADGIKFTQHYSGQAVCAPCRCILMTGKHSGRTYIRDNGDPKDGSTKQFLFQVKIQYLTVRLQSPKYLRREVIKQQL